MIDIERIKSIKGKLSGFIDHHDVAEPTVEEFMIIVDELIAIRELKGDQVPVAWRMWPEGDYDEGFIVNHDEDPVKDPTATDAKGQRWVSSPLYDRPQKPVVLPKFGPNDDPHNLGRNIGIKECKVAIEAAGGIVKDGE